MNNLDNKFKKINKIPHLSQSSKQKIKREILNHTQQSWKFTPKFITLILTISMLSLTYLLITANEKSEVSTSDKLQFEQTISDSYTPEKISRVTASENTFTIKWLSNSMDRGNHDLDTSVHGDLVVSKDIEPLTRGDIIYYEMSQKQIGRIIGLPGETLEIREGQVYIDNKKLDTFYGIATSMGLTKEEYFKNVSLENRNGEAMLEYFNTTIDPVYINEGAIFVLVDNWWRGSDSRDYGPISIDQVKAKVLGYED